MSGNPFGSGLVAADATPFKFQNLLPVSLNMANLLYDAHAEYILTVLEGYTNDPFGRLALATHYPAFQVDMGGQTWRANCHRRARGNGPVIGKGQAAHADIPDMYILLCPAQQAYLNGNG